MSGVTESTVESAALAWLEVLGCTVTHGPAAAGGCGRISIRPARGLAISRWTTLQSAEPQGCA
jgi:hypothetical protein